MQEIDLEEQLANRIASGDLRPGERLPPERDLGKAYAVGRTAVREAIGSLERRGLLTRKEGREVYVSRPKVEHDLRGVEGFTEQMERAGLSPGARLLSAMVIVAPPRIAQALRLDPSARVAKIERVRYAARMALTLEETWLPDALFPEITGLGLTESVYALMRECYGRGPERAVERLEAVPAAAHEAKLLAIPTGAPLMLVVRTSYDQDGTPIEFARDRHRGDRAQFVVETQPRVVTGG